MYVWVWWAAGNGIGSGRGFGSGQAVMVWAMICHAFAMVWMV